MVTRLLVLFTTVLMSFPAVSDEREMFNSVRPSVAKLVATGTNGRYFFGSGVALPNGRMVTNCHVIQQARSIAVAQGQSPVRAAASVMDWNHDLCLLELSGLTMRPVALRDSRTLRVGEQVYAVGHNLGLSLTFQGGRVEELYPLDGGVVIRTTASFSTGASGGGLFDADGNLVGILTFYRIVKGKEAEYFAVPVEWIAGLTAGTPAQAGTSPATPFWADSLDQQPNFLKAATLEVEDRWDELLSLSRTWTEHHPADGHAWSTLGKSLDRTGDLSAAQEAFRRAEELGVRRASLP